MNVRMHARMHVCTHAWFQCEAIQCNVCMCSAMMYVRMDVCRHVRKLACISAYTCVCTCTNIHTYTHHPSIHPSVRPSVRSSNHPSINAYMHMCMQTFFCIWFAATQPGQKQKALEGVALS